MRRCPRWRRTGRLLFALPLLAGLAGCSDEPTEAEMHRLVEAHVARQLAARHQGGFDGFALFRKQGCLADPAQPRTWNCYYNLVYPPQPGRDHDRFNGKGRFQRTDKSLTYQELSAMPDDRPLR